MIVVTGATGHIGNNLVRELVKSGRHVRCLVHRNTGPIQDLLVEFVEGDVRDLSSLIKAFTGTEVVYHLAAYITLRSSDLSLAKTINTLGTRNVLQASLECGVRRLVHFSSIHALEQQPYNKPVDESNPLALSKDNVPYDYSKAVAELEVRKANSEKLNTIVINPTGIIGPNDHQLSFFGRALLQMAHGKLPLLVDGGFDWVDVRDVVKASIFAEQHAPPGSRYILSGHWRTLKAVSNEVANVIGKKRLTILVPLWMAYLGLPFTSAYSRANGQQPIYTRTSLEAIKSNPHIDHSLAAKELKFHPRDFHNTIRDTIQWFAQNGYLDKYK